MSDYSRIDSYLEKNMDNSIAELSKLVAQPSISAQGIGLKECAAMVAEMLRTRGFSAEIMETEGAPVVFGERKGKSEKTLIFYNHYDVQPPEPLELWETPPFEPSLRDGKLYGRGVSDDKSHASEGVERAGGCGSAAPAVRVMRGGARPARSSHGPRAAPAGSLRLHPALAG